MMPGVLMRGGVALAREVTGASGSDDLECTAGFAGAKMRMRQEHRILGRPGMVGKVVGRYGAKSMWPSKCADSVGYSGLAI
jgi:hypothetical protein